MKGSEEIMEKKVSKKMLINTVHPEEARVAIVHDGRLMELNVEITGKEQIKGNIYKGVVLRIEPSLQAAFVDIGRARPGFLQMGELHPDYWQWRDDIPEEQRKRRPRIQEVLRRGQELMVQVEKDERDHKGSALTSYVSLPGRYMVIMPGGDAKGISRKVVQEGERNKLKEIVAAMNIPEGMGYIIRTEAVGRSAEEIVKDYDNLMSLYEDIKRSCQEIKNAGEVYQDKGLICRFIRDYFSDDIDEVLVDSKEAYRDAKDYFREVMPKCEKLVKLHKEKRPIFSRFQLEEQIDQIYEKRVALPSGGYLIIEPTEALVSIDVNSGKSSGERGIEETAFKTNLEAVEEVARQLRLRDLGGLIVIDCIDMREKKHDIEVERTLKQALKMDKARVNVGRISEFGMLEMSRQRIAKTLNDGIHLECPHCEGKGKVKSVEAMAVSFLRKVHAAAAKGTVSEAHGGLPLEVAYYLLNRKKRELVQIENDYDLTVTVKGKTSFLLNQLELEIVKRDKIKEENEPEHKENQPVPPAIQPLPIESSESEVAESLSSPVLEGEAVKKKKRRRKKKKQPVTDLDMSPDTNSADIPSLEPIEQQESVSAGEQQSQIGESVLKSEQETVTETSETGEAVAKKKRKRRRKKPANKTAKPQEQDTEITDTTEINSVETVQETTPPVSEPATTKKQISPSRSRTKIKDKVAAVETALKTAVELTGNQVVSNVQYVESEQNDVDKPAAAKKQTRKKKLANDDNMQEPVKDLVLEEPSTPKVVPKKTAARKKPVADATKIESEIIDITKPAKAPRRRATKVKE